MIITLNFGTPTVYQLQQLTNHRLVYMCKQIGHGISVLCLMFGLKFMFFLFFCKISSKEVTLSCYCSFDIFFFFFFLVSTPKTEVRKKNYVLLFRMSSYVSRPWLNAFVVFPLRKLECVSCLHLHHLA